MAERRDEERSVLARIRVIQPLEGCAYGLQCRDGSVEQLQLATMADLTFTTSITMKIARDGLRDPAGRHVNGPRTGRFLYVTSGTRAQQSDSCWDRRAKVSLKALDAAVPMSLDVMPPLIEIVIAGTAKDGGPACASVEPVSPWMHVL
jgi:hypothetical protein